ncbi:MAG: SGNH/GDSL hydrolase family protein [Planctomycetaceae bacterium]
MSGNSAVVLTAVLCVSTFGTSAAQEASELPAVVLVGDSIRLSYAPVVTKELQGKARVISAAANGGDSSNVLKHLNAWVIAAHPAVVHLNCGIHDTKYFRDSERFQVSPEQYEANLRTIVEAIRSQTTAMVIFATTTPILDDRAAATRQKTDYVLTNDAVNRYNSIARRVMEPLKVPVNDLNTSLTRPSAPLQTGELIADDGVHLTQQARELLGRQVAAEILKHLPVKELSDR